MMLSPDEMCVFMWGMECDLSGVVRFDGALQLDCLSRLQLAYHIFIDGEGSIAKQLRLPRAVGLHHHVSAWRIRSGLLGTQRVSG